MVANKIFLFSPYNTLYFTKYVCWQTNCFPPILDTLNFTKCTAYVIGSYIKFSVLFFVCVYVFFTDPNSILGYY